ncbi:SMP-30/gluconolactonase/LRE family protein [Pseudoduganella eburnea]|uniref:SMP-30/gluconolactonase/LRE family protein n=1 Tax=Massilia eburnea TaxID=1776165 RepID=A0A6L6QAP2_9BURK|nr:SMP-30/gluconolactonase/LRE family protein [Massilia eburnea]
MAAGAGLTLAALLAYLLLWPVPAEPVIWSPQQGPGYVGAHAPNTKLAGLQKIDIGAERGPEHIAMGPDGKLYAAVASGNILRMAADGSQREVFANTGGRVLGFDFDASGRLVAADAMKGLLAITPDGKIAVLTDKVADGDPIRYADGVVVAPNGTVYFTDASTRFAPAEWGGTFEASVLDILEQSSTGRVLAFNPASGKTSILASGLSFANGIALSGDGKTLFVNETGRYRIWKIDAASGKRAILFDNLPGYPDNLMRGRDGKIWVGLVKPRNPTIDKLAGKPFMRKLTLRLPRGLWPVPKAYGHVFAFSEDGKVLADLQDPSGAYPETTAVMETPDRLYVQSLHAGYIGWMPHP